MSDEQTQEQTQEETTTETTTELQRPSWQDQLPQEMLEDKSLWGYAKPKDMVADLKEKSAKAAELEEKLKTATPQVPESYELTPPTLPEGVEHDTELETNFRALAKELGLTQKQAEGIYNWNNQRVISVFENMAKVDEKAAEINTAELQKPENWGAEFDKNLAMMVRGTNWVEKNVPEFQELGQQRLSTGVRLADSIPFAKLAAQIGKAIAEDTMVGGRSSTGEMTERQKLEAQYPTMVKERTA
jgi:hypothetical protein